MPEYVNPNPFMVALEGPDRIVIKVKPYSKIILPEYYDIYVAKGLIKPVHAGGPNLRTQRVIPPLVKRISKPKPRPVIESDTNKIKKLPPDTPRHSDLLLHRAVVPQKKIKGLKEKKSKTPASGKIVGISSRRKGMELLAPFLKGKRIPISNNIGVGILSYNRLNCLRRLVTSIRRNTDLNKTTIFISDDASTDPELSAYLDELKSSGDLVIMKNDQRLGVAGNSNRLLRCLSRFKYAILLNDDVEVLDPGWEYFYAKALEQTGMHHFMMRQPGVYGAKEGTAVICGGLTLNRVDDKPHGAILAFTHLMLSKCGFFNEKYGLYGMEHIDWSAKAWEFDLQPRGFFDVGGSSRFFMLHNQPSAVKDRDGLLRSAKVTFDTRKEGVRELPSPSTELPEITYIIPYRDSDRSLSIRTVVNNIRAQRFPVINVIVSEQDNLSKLSTERLVPIEYIHTPRADNPLFNKSYAFNQAVCRAPNDALILHDADMVTFGDYAQKIWDILRKSDSCHIGARVLYTDQSSCENLNTTGELSDFAKCERVVEYYEGGSIACTKDAYWSCGAFNEDFWGYGCEDCDFYTRLSSVGKWHEDRYYDLVHLWHPRVEGWNCHHDKNKQLEDGLKLLTVAERVKAQIEQLSKNGYNRYLQEVGLL